MTKVIYGCFAGYSGGVQVEEVPVLKETDANWIVDGTSAATEYRRMVPKINTRMPISADRDAAIEMFIEQQSRALAVLREEILECGARLEQAKNLLSRKAG